MSYNDMRVTRGQFLRRGAATAGGIVFAGQLAACGSSSSGSAKKGGAAVFGQIPDINLTDLFAPDNSNYSWEMAVFETLTLYSPSLVPQPRLATSWTTSADGRTITLNLRSGVKFHSGRPFGPNDVVFAIDTIQKASAGSQLMSTALAITDVAPKGNSVVVQLAHPITNFFDILEVMPIVDPETYSGVTSGKTVIGTGPFLFSSYSPGNQLILKKNPNYWQAGRPLLDQITIRVIAQPQALVAALTSGQADMIIDISPQQATSVTGSGFKVILLNPRDGGYYVASNVKVPPFDKKEVRQAIAWAIDRERLNKEVFNGAALVTSLPWASSSPAYNSSQASTYSYNPAKAKALLSAAGVSGAHVDFAMSSVEPTSDALAQVVEFSLGQVGITVKPVAYDQPEFVSHLTGGTMPGLFTEVHGFGSVHPATLLKGAFPFNSEKNASNFVDPTYQALVDRVWTAPSASAAQSAYTAVNAFLLDQQFVSDLINYGHLVATKSSFGGFVVNRFDYMVLENATSAG